MSVLLPPATRSFLPLHWYLTANETPRLEVLQAIFTQFPACVLAKDSEGQLPLTRYMTKRHADNAVCKALLSQKLHVAANPNLLAIQNFDDSEKPPSQASSARALPRAAAARFLDA